MRIFGIAMLFSMLLTGCVSKATIKNLDDVKADEAVVVAKVTLRYNDDDETDGGNLLFGVADKEVVQAMPGKDGYIFARFPRGKHTIKTMIIKTGSTIRGFAANELTFEVNGTEPVYVGDLLVDWHGVGFIGRVIGQFDPIAANLWQRQGQYALNVTSDLAAAQKAFGAKFSTDRKLTERLIQVAAPKAESSVSPSAAATQ